MSETFDANTNLSDMALNETGGLSDLTGGDAVAAKMVSEIRNTIATVHKVTRMTVAEAERLAADDLANPEGVARRLEELPKDLEAATYALHENAASAIAVLEARLTTVALNHDPIVTGVSDTTLSAELQNYTANLSPSNAAVRLVELAANPRYSTFMSGPFGASLAARFGTDPQSLVRVALQTVAQSGTPSQRKAAAALSNIHKATRPLALSKAGTQNAVRSIRETKQTPRQAYQVREPYSV